MIEYNWKEYQYEEHLSKAKQWYKFIRKRRCPVCKSKGVQLVSQIQKKGFMVITERCTNKECRYTYKYIMNDK